MFNPFAYANSRPGGIGVLEVVEASGGPARARHAQKTPRRFVPLRRSLLRGEIIGPLASLRFTQVYRYTSAECDRVLEALYRFPLPGDAAVTGVHVRFGQTEIRAALKERGRAEADYEEAKRQGWQSALATRESPDVFTLQVAGIRPDEEVTVETSYVQLARPEGVGWSLRIPLTTSPRYVRSDELTARHARGQPLALLRDPGHRFALDLTVRGATTVRSDTHRLDVTLGDSAARVRLADGEVLPDRDCVLSWRPPGEEKRPVLQLWLHDDLPAGALYFLALVTPPSVKEGEGRPAGEPVAREVILLVDHSGSMEGPKWEAADWAVKQFLAGLSERDAFALGLFHSTTRWWAREPRPATREAVRDAIRFLEEQKETGGTELGVALEQALSLPHADGPRARHLLILTDAEVTDAGRLLRLAEGERTRQDRRRISLLCIDAAPNALLVHELATCGGGSARFLTSDPEEEDITTALDEVLAEWAAPALSGLRLEVNRVGLQSAGAEPLPGGPEGWSALDLGDLPSGRTAWLAGRVPRGEVSDLCFRLVASERGKIATARPVADGKRGNLDSQAEETGAWLVDLPALKALFGARQLLRLEYLLHAGHDRDGLHDGLCRLGYDPEAVLGSTPGGRRRLYAENLRDDATAALHQFLVREALDYGITTAQTAFVAVREEAGRPVEQTVFVANALPHGWSGRFLTPGSGGAIRALSAVPPSWGAVFAAASAPTLAGDDEVLGGEAADDGDVFLMEVADAAQLSAAQARAASPPTSHLFGPLKRATSSAEARVLFGGRPALAETGGESLLAAVLWESAGADPWPEMVRLEALTVTFPDGWPEPDALDPEIALLLYIEELAAPRARVRLADLVRQGGRRPLNLLRRPGQEVRLLLQDPNGAWVKSPPRIEVGLEWTAG